MTINVQVVDFAISASPTPVTTSPGVAATSVIYITPVNGFTGTVTLATTVSPSGLTCTLSSTSITGGTGTSTLSCTGSGGTYTVTVTGTTPSITGTATVLSHSATVTVNVSDFTITASPTSLSIVQGSAASSTITITSLGGFSGTVTLTYSASSSLTIKLSPSSIAMAGTATLTVNSTSSTPTGTYLVNVTGTSGPLTHAVTVTVTVTSAVLAKAPYFLVLWSQKISLSKSGTATQSWLYIVWNENKQSTVYAAITISGTDGSGVNSFTVTSSVFKLNAYGLAFGTLTETFNNAQVGDTFHFTAVLLWGTTSTTNPAALPYVGSYSITGSFTVTAYQGH